MLRKLRQRINEEKGFTLIELLVVILIIGILAAIALPAFLGQQVKGQDSEAKSDARNTVSQIEACFANEQNYALCDTAAELPNSGLDIGGSIAIAGADEAGYAVTATSKSDNTFTITKTAAGSERTCAKVNDDRGGCKSDNTW